MTNQEKAQKFQDIFRRGGVDVEKVMVLGVFIRVWTRSQEDTAKVRDWFLGAGYNVAIQGPTKIAGRLPS